MDLLRRELLGAAGLGLMAVRSEAQSPADAMYGLIGKMIAAPGKRDSLIAILLEGTRAMPGCLSYVVARDAANADVIWITEVWDSKASHDASLSLSDVRAAIAKGRPLIASFEPPVVTAPAGGVGISLR